MNGDSVLLLVDELLRPWRILDVAFYAGSLYGVYKLTTFAFKVIKGVRTYFIPAGRAANSDLSQTFGKWAGLCAASLVVKNPYLFHSACFLFTDAVVTGATSALGLAFAHEVCLLADPVFLIAGCVCFP